MSKKKFNNLITGSSKPTKSDVSLLEELQKNHPYSQVIHALSAKAHKATKSDKVKQKIGFAAIYSTDRIVLKSFLEGTPLPSPSVEDDKIPLKQKTEPETQKSIIEEKKATEDQVDPETKAVVEESQVKEDVGEEPEETHQRKAEPVESIETIGDTTEESLDIETVRNEIMASLESLSKSKEKFNQAESKKKVSTPKKVKAKAPKKTSAQKPVKKSSTVKKKVKTKSPVENKFVDAINSREEIPIGKKQKKQNKLIEEFITKQPRVQKPEAEPDSMDQETQDLARQSVNFGDDLVSENLAIIFTEQGKKDKAIDIYKKLIWKYPKKKTYFAGQIKKLQNS